MIVSGNVQDLISLSFLTRLSVAWRYQGDRNDFSNSHVLCGHARCQRRIDLGTCCTA